MSVIVDWQSHLSLHSDSPVPWWLDTLSPDMGMGHGSPHSLGIGLILRGVLLDVTFNPEHTDVMRSTYSLKLVVGGRLRF